MNGKDYSVIKAQYESRYEQIKKEIDDFTKYAINYDEMEDDFDPDWNDGKDQRRYETLLRMRRIIRSVIDLIDEIEAATDDKAKHSARKSVEMLNTEYEGFKYESEEVIASENQVIEEADLALNELKDFCIE